MIFNSVTFLLFLGAFLLLYWTLPRRPRHWLIFLGSLAFYGFWRIDFIVILLFSISTDYAAALLIEKSRAEWKRRLFLLLSLSVNLGLLAYFKYAQFLLDNWWRLTGALGFDGAPSALSIILPLGISFYTFQSMSYTLDVYRRQIAAEHDYLCFANFVLFFPQLVAGPILRGVEVIPQLRDRPFYNPLDIPLGIKLIIAGLFLKVVLADNLAPLVDDGFSYSVASLAAKDSWALASLFGYQIYFDFAGYSLIAIGCARMMGVHFPANFNFPYISHSPREFWRRWHISLSSWIRDYLYLPLCGARVHDVSVGGLAEATGDAGPKTNPARKTWALVATWAIMGLWHGANWTYVLWGLWHALLILVYRWLSPLLRLPRRPSALVGWLLTYPLVILGWIPFRAQNLDDALTLMSYVFIPASYAVPFALPRHYYTLSLLLPAASFLAYLAHLALPKLRRLPLAGGLFYATGLACAIALVFVFLRPVRQFIYFQF